MNKQLISCLFESAENLTLERSKLALEKTTLKKNRTPEAFKIIDAEINKFNSELNRINQKLKALS